jgi:hypothetical protein
MCPLIWQFFSRMCHRISLFFRRMTAPGFFLRVVECLLLLPLGFFIIFEGLFELSEKYKYSWLIPQALYGILCAASFYLATRVDTREPSPSRNSFSNRVIAFGTIMFFLAVLEWSMRNVVKKMSSEAYVGHFVAVNTAIYIRFVCVFSMLYHEIPNSVNRIRCIELWAEFGLLILAITLFILHMERPGSSYESIVFLLVRTFLFFSSVSVTHVVAGKYRTIAIHDPVQYVLNMVEVV